MLFNSANMLRTVFGALPSARFAATNCSMPLAVMRSSRMSPKNGTR
jgi:hypothetical protein